MATVKAGVVSGVEVNGPSMVPDGKVWDLQSGGTWALIWFMIAVVALFVIL